MRKAALRVLVVDDMPDAAESLARLLRVLGHEAEYLTNSREALEKAKAFMPHVVLLDIGMPHINGYELAPLMRKALEPLPVCIVAVTAYGSPEDRVQSRKAQFDAHVVKPMDVKLLEATLEEITKDRPG
jgi:two-component system CheB/CheR fusion protein